MDWIGLWERYSVWLDVHGLVLGHPEDQWTGLDYERDNCVGLDVCGQS